MHELAMLIMLVRQVSWLMMNFKWHHVNLSGPGADKLLHLLIADLNSSLEKRLQEKEGLCSTLLRMLRSTCRFRAVLNVL